MSKVTKTYQVTKAAGGWWVASTPTVDRQSDRVMPLGLDLTNYRQNPVLMWAHDYKSPWSIIGRAADLQVTAADLRVKPEWRQPANDSDPMAIIRALLDQGLVKAMSIGFNPRRSTKNEHGGYDFTEADLLEISICPIGANAEALQLAVKALGGDPRDFVPETRAAIVARERARGAGSSRRW